MLPSLRSISDAVTVPCWIDVARRRISVQFLQMLAPRPRSVRVLSPGTRLEVELARYPHEQRFGWADIVGQRRAREAQGAEVDGEPEPVVVAATLLDWGEILCVEGVVADQVGFIGWDSE